MCQRLSWRLDSAYRLETLMLGERRSQSAVFPILILRPDFGAWRPSTDGVCADMASCFLN
jgi:hypothetical protein